MTAFTVAIFTICAAVFIYYQFSQTIRMKNDFQVELNDLNQHSQQDNIKPVELYIESLLSV